ncbi:class II fructose-bisphosphate aldolase [Candidatus Uhrbacteria bacterium]|nr:class II fructose-bisphosphate aldolase [Candidatus Uhrbacteria bacterium]
MLVSAKTILEKANRGKYAVPAFNVNNMEMIQAIMAGAVQMKSPVILQTTEGAVRYAGMAYLVAMVQLAAEAHVPVALHLDHGKDIKLIKQALEAGYTSVMIDASDGSFADNVRLTKLVVERAHVRKISVEAELGAIVGVEDLVSVSQRDAHLTSPRLAADFVRQTGCDCLGVAIGTSHGAYKFKGMPHLDIKRLQEIKKAVRIPLALHGASGVPSYIVRLGTKYGAQLGKAQGNSDKEIRAAVRGGINKVNIDTDLRLAFTAGVRQALALHKGEFDPRKILKPARELMTQVVTEKIKLLGCGGRA